MGPAHVKRRSPFGQHALTGSVAVLVAAILSVALLIPAHAATPRAVHNARGTLVFYSAQGYDSAVARAFQKVSGTSVLLTDDSTSNILAKIEAERCLLLPDAVVPAPGGLTSNVL